MTDSSPAVLTFDGIRERLSSVCAPASAVSTSSISAPHLCVPRAGRQRSPDGVAVSAQKLVAAWDARSAEDSGRPGCGSRARGHLLDLLTGLVTRCAPARKGRPAILEMLDLVALRSGGLARPSDPRGQTVRRVVALDDLVGDIPWRPARQPCVPHRPRGQHDVSADRRRHQRRGLGTSHPVTLFTGQRADLTREEVAAHARARGLRRPRDDALRGAPRRVGYRGGLPHNVRNKPEILERPAQCRGHLRPPQASGGLARAPSTPGTGHRRLADVGGDGDATRVRCRRRRTSRSPPRSRMMAWTQSSARPGR